MSILAEQKDDVGLPRPWHLPLFQMTTLFPMLLIGLNASTVLESAFSKQNCIGVPSAMRLFNVDDLESYTPNPGEIWTRTYSFITGEFMIGECGNLMVDINGQCCYNSLDLDASFGVESAYEIAVDDIDLFDAIPANALNQQYCQLTTLDDSAIWGYQSLYVYPNEQCVDQTRCFPNGTLAIYKDTDCQKLDFSLNQKSVVNSTVLGLFGFEWYKIEKATAITAWATYTPSNLLIPTYKSPAEILALLDFFIAGLACLYALIRQFGLWWSRRMNSKIDGTFFIMNLCWMTYIPLRFGFWACVFNDLWAVAAYYEAMYVMLALSTYMSTVFTTKYFMDAIFMLDDRKKKLLYFLLFALHFGLAGKMYFAYFTSLPIYYADLIQKIKSWGKYTGIWIMIMFGYNILPLFAWITFLVARRQKKQTVPMTLGIRFSLAKKVYCLLACQIVVVAAYFGIDLVRKTSALLFDDRADLAIGGIQSVFLVYHSLLLQATVKEIKNVMNQMIQTKKQVAIQAAAEVTSEQVTQLERTEIM